MVNTQHNSLTTTDLHENKGVVSATNNTVATASSGATLWKLLDNTNLGPLANPFGAAYIHLQEQQNSGTAAGGTTSGASWTKRTLNQKLTDDVGITLATSQFTLPAGTYFVYGTFPGHACDFYQAKLRNVTDSTDTIIGTSERTPSTTVFIATTSNISGRFTIAGSKTFEIDQRLSTTNTTNGFGVNASMGVTEVYGDLHIWKIG